MPATRSLRALVLSLVALAPASVTAQSLAPDAIAPDAIARVDRVFARFGPTTPGCALGVRKDGQLAYARGYGLASLELGVPITSRTVFDIGSTSKQVTAATVALLALEGRLSLDDDVRTHVPELPDLGQRITLRHLLTHTSGWRDYIDVLSLEGWDDRDHTTDREALAALVRQRALNFPPGTDHRYSNTGFFLISVVVQRVTGTSLAEVARTRFFEPLGMRDTRYLTDAREVIPNKASAYEPAGEGAWRIAMSNWEQIGDGGVQTTVEDLAKWDAQLDAGTVGGKALLELLVTPIRLTDGTPVPYALGLAVDSLRGLPRVSHGGAWAGFRAMLMRFPTERTSILIACNVADANTSGLATGVAWALLPPASLAAEPEAAVARPALDRAADLAGTFLDPRVGQLVRVTARGDTLTLAGPGRPTLVSLGERRYRHSSSNAEWRWERDGAGGDRWIVRSGTGPSVRMTRVTPTPATLRLRDYEGTYASAEAGTEWRIVVRDSAIVAVPRRGAESVLRPAFRDAFGGAGLVRFERDAAGRVVALTITTRGVQALRFTRR